MLELVAAKGEKAKAQRSLKSFLQSALPYQGERNIGYPGGNATLALFSRGKGAVWYGYKPTPDEEIPRYWNAFGIFEPNSPSQMISVELNVPIDTNGRQVSSFFAFDKESGKTYLMHSGRVGGGTKGIGKSAFLAWSRNKLVSVLGAHGQERQGIVVGSLDRHISGRIEHFVKRVATFKALVKAGDLDTPEFKKQIAEFDRFKPEFSGRKSGHSGGAIDYVSYHGDIVSEIYNRRSQLRGPNELVFNTPLIDLGVRSNGRLVEVYEVKTATDRQAIYTAIGQLMVHSSGTTTQKFLVIPAAEDLPPDVLSALKRLSIATWKFTISSDGFRVRIQT